jgi:CRP/FNR family transcriptional regulator, nitrogen oxide reductase regulator
MPLLSCEEQSFFLNGAPFFRGLSKDVILAFLDLGRSKVFKKGEFITRIGDYAEDVVFLITGLIRVCACSSSGRQFTFLLLNAGDPYNLMGPYLKRQRFLEARAIIHSRCLCIHEADFTRFVETHPPIITNIMQWIGVGIDSAHSRLLDMMDKKASERIMRALGSLHAKFGSPLLFTNQDISGIACTTTETTIRTMSFLRELGIIETRRGKIWIKDPVALKDVEFGDLTF